jgi:hypothetical protein
MATPPTAPNTPPPTRIISFSQLVQEADPNYRRTSLQPVTYEFQSGRKFIQPVNVYGTGT